jgi:hypothetical protein
MGVSYPVGRPDASFASARGFQSGSRQQNLNPHFRQANCGLSGSLIFPGIAVLPQIFGCRIATERWLFEFFSWVAKPVQAIHGRNRQ